MKLFIYAYIIRLALGVAYGANNNCEKRVEELIQASEKYGKYKQLQKSMAKASQLKQAEEINELLKAQQYILKTRLAIVKDTCEK